MAYPRRTQKQIAERYKGNLGYYKKLHPWRRARWAVSFLAIAGREGRPTQPLSAWLGRLPAFALIGRRYVRTDA